MDDFCASIKKNAIISALLIDALWAISLQAQVCEGCNGRPPQLTSRDALTSLKVALALLGVDAHDALASKRENWDGQSFDR